MMIPLGLSGGLQEMVIWKVVLDNEIATGPGATRRENI